MSPRASRRPAALRTALAAAATVLAAAPSARADDDLLPLPAFRVELGPVIHIGQVEPTFALDLDAGAVVLFGNDFSFALNPELGYSFDSYGSHAFNLLFGFGGGVPLAYMLLQPRFLAGTLVKDGGSGADETFAATGMRNGIGLHFLFDLVSVEVGHQFLYSDGTFHNDVHVMFGTNPASAAMVLALLAGSAH
ncbi:MAG: hypothetical protein HY908_37810 [Myxococcales bacterium]|nr:hypothetical protein [Myxococcales bacterium]